MMVVGSEEWWLHVAWWMAVWRASSGSHHGGADWRSIWWRPRTGTKVVEVDDDLSWSVEWVSWRVTAMAVILLRGGAVAVLR